MYYKGFVSLLYMEIVEWCSNDLPLDAHFKENWSNVLNVTKWLLCYIQQEKAVKSMVLLPFRLFC